MTIEFVVGFLVVLLGLSLVAEAVASRMRLPHSLILVLLGAGTGYFVTLGLDIDTGLRATNFHNLIFFVFLPVLVFEAAFKISLPELKANLGIIVFLAIAGMLLTTCISAVFLYFGIGHPTGFPWIAALLAGALLAATDPVAVVAQMNTLGAPKRLAVLLEGESLFNDATAIVIFSIFLTLATMPASEVTVGGAIGEFCLVFVGGSLVGALFGALGVYSIRHVRNGMSGAVVTLTAAYGSFLVAEGVLHVSGVMGSLVAGLMLSRANATHSSRDSGLDYFWSALSYVANGSVFLLMGVTITVAMFTERWLAMLIAVGAVLAARILATYGGLTALNLLPGERVPGRYQTVIVWGGLRGAVTLALALALPIELDYWWTIQSMAFGVVLFTLFVQAPTMPWLLRRTGLT
jgi:CPA1 family monovalent cation:H+ antiporter